MSQKPFVLFVSSHKGGTSRTTTSVALAWKLAQQGDSVTLVDAAPCHSASILLGKNSQQEDGLNQDSSTHQQNTKASPHMVSSSIKLVTSDANQLPDKLTGKWVIVDGPLLTQSTAMTWLKFTDSVLLTCLADPLSLWTLNTATQVLKTAKQSNKALQLMGILLSNVQSDHAFQAEAITKFKEAYHRLMLPMIPHQREISEWGSAPGSAIPAGVASSAFDKLAQRLTQLHWSQQTNVA